MVSKHNIRLNPNRSKAVHTGITLASGDKGITLQIEVEEMDCSNATAKIVFKRNNGTSVEADITGSDNVYTYELQGNELAVPGLVVADVKFYEGEKRISTATFTFTVSSDTMDGLGAGAGGYSDRLEQLVAEAEEAGELTEQAKVELEAAENNLESMEAEMAAVLKNFKEQYGSSGGLTPRGNWNSSVSYAIRDIVYYMGYSWICVVANKGVAPAEASAYWMKHAEFDYVNENLLVNSYFLDPVNSSGKTEWIKTSYGSIIDSWYVSTGFTVSLVENGLQIHPTETLNANSMCLIEYVNFEQENCEITYSIKASVNNAKTFIRMYAHDESNTQLSYSNKIAVTEGITSVTFTTPKNTTKLRVTVSMDSGAAASDIVCIEWAKLELGKAATLPTPPNKEVEKLKCGATVGDAESVNGYHASDFLDETLYPISTDCNAEMASADKKVRIRRYTADTLNSPYTEGETTYSQGLIITYSFSSTYATQFALAGYSFFTRRYANGMYSPWRGFFPLDGSVPMSGSDLFIYNGLGRIASNTEAVQLETRPAVGDTNNRRFIILRNPTSLANINSALRISEIVDGVQSTYDILHAGNSVPVATGTTAPTNTAAMWYDTANNTWKRYVNGAWTAA